MTLKTLILHIGHMIIDEIVDLSHVLLMSTNSWFCRWSTTIGEIGYIYFSKQRSSGRWRLRTFHFLWVFTSVFQHANIYCSVRLAYMELFSLIESSLNVVTSTDWREKVKIFVRAFYLKCGVFLLAASQLHHCSYFWRCAYVNWSYHPWKVLYIVLALFLALSLGL